MALQEVDQGVVGGVLVVGRAVSGEAEGDLRATPRELAHEVADQARLADPRLAADQDRLPVSLAGLSPELDEPGPFALAGGAPRGLRGSTRVSLAHHLVDR